uniref:winged helix-turn-helix domain-containing protein n=1 Tax=Streptomyces olivaceoviridis TaxID=1921 RepID=UPI001E4B60AE|nr:winged helix-turn-helix domain-containing protein [Streptomyces olivaceoviridis]
MFHVSCGVFGAARLMHRLGFGPQIPARRVAEGGGHVAVWKEATGAEVEEPVWPAEAASASRTRPGSPAGRPKDAPGAGVGGTPVVTVSGGWWGCLSVVGLIVMRSGSRVWLCHCLGTHRVGAWQARQPGRAGLHGADRGRPPTRQGAHRAGGGPCGHSCLPGHARVGG